ncbi:uncharacterized protein LOC112086020 [Eutrema salsugineum]|uniref:uncharacterized protein LOC112086020 n=1 Tax=Eutrema salsugineum TaxID=72664 RepID=UPI000CED0F89|nr:uncharacterized protein LOC112086020 [Eutrema salsugineum]
MSKEMIVKIFKKMHLDIERLSQNWLKNNTADRESSREDGVEDADVDDSGDDVWNDDNISDPLTDDEKEVEGMPMTCHPEQIFALGKCFNNADEFKNALLRYSLKTSDRLGAKCTLNKKRKVSLESTCCRKGGTKLLKRGVIPQLYEERLSVILKIKSQEMVDEIKREYNMIVTVSQSRRAKSVLAAQRKASHESHFARLWYYQEEYCRLIIGLDGAFMKWDNKGQMLAAIDRDGDNRIFPISWALVEVEDNPNWLWFVQLIKKDLDPEDGEELTIISDKHRGILNTVHEELPNAEYRMCSRHILENWKKTYTDIELERLFWRIGRSYTPEVFGDNLEALKKYNVESFNLKVRESRRLPLLEFLTEIRRKVMERNAKRKASTIRWKKRFTPRADREIESNRQKARKRIRYMTTRNQHKIDFHGLDLNDYVSNYYLTSKWRDMYAEGMKPVQGMKAWRMLGRLPILPPLSRFNRRRLHGRARKKGPQESSSNPNK